MATEYLNNKNFQDIIHRFQQSQKDKAKYSLIIEDLDQSVNRINRDHINFKTKKKLLVQIVSAFDCASNEYILSQNELAVAFYTLSGNIVNYARFSNIDPDDATQEGVMICFDKIDRFDPRKGKAFNYMTTCILNHFRQLYRAQRNYQELKRKYQSFLQVQINKHIIKNGREISVPRN